MDGWVRAATPWISGLAASARDVCARSWRDGENASPPHRARREYAARLIHHHRRTPAANEKVVTHARYVAFQIKEVAIPRDLFADIFRMIAALRSPPLASAA